MKLDASDEKKHVALWKWLAKNPNKEKWQWPHFREMQKAGLPHPTAGCFLCRIHESRDTDCTIACPLKGCQSGSAIFIKWQNAKTPEDRTRFALIIANCFKSPLTRKEVL